MLPQGLCGDESVTTADENSQGEGSLQLPSDLAQESAVC